MGFKEAQLDALKRLKYKKLMDAMDKTVEVPKVTQLPEEEESEPKETEVSEMKVKPEEEVSASEKIIKTLDEGAYKGMKKWFKKK